MKKKKVANLDEYRRTKEFTDAIESGTLYDELRPKKEVGQPTNSKPKLVTDK